MEPVLRRLLRRFPSVKVLGPRPPRAQDARTLHQCMRDLKLSRGYLVHSGRQHYSLGNGVTALSAELILSRPQNFMALTRRPLPRTEIFSFAVRPEQKLKTD